jgi:hypothetical protein
MIWRLISGLLASYGLPFSHNFSNLAAARVGIAVDLQVIDAARGPVAAGRQRPLCGIPGLAVMRAGILWFVIQGLSSLTGLVRYIAGSQAEREVCRVWQSSSLN